jgi:hypothetical protein
MNKWLILVVLVLLVLTTAMGLESMTRSVLMAPTTAPAPTIPWGSAVAWVPTTAPAPTIPWGPVSLAPTTAPAPTIPWGSN